MPKSRHTTQAVGACSLSLATILSGCGAIVESTLIQAACENRCCGLKEADYRHCKNLCMKEQAREHSEWKAKASRESHQAKISEKEQLEFDKKVTEKLLRNK
jgi:hypothetical protein